MGLEHIIKSISKDKEEALSAIRKNTEVRKREIEKEKNIRLDKIKEESKKRAIYEADSINKREHSKALIAAREVYRKAIEDEINNAFDGLRKKLPEFLSSEDYAKVLKGMVNKATEELGDDCIIEARKEDINAIKKQAKKASIKEADIAGGIIADSKDGKMHIDYSIESILSEMNAELSREFYSIIAGSKNTKIER